MRTTALLLFGLGAAVSSAQPLGTHFSGAITSNSVLQKGATTSAAVLGTVQGATSGTVVTVTVAEAGAAPYSVRADIVGRGNGNLTWHARLHPHPAPGGNATISASCASCSNDSKATLVNITWGDVWFCAGQSNMELPMDFALTRNRTFAALDAGRYQNIRTFKHRHGGAPGGARFDGDEQWILPPPVSNPQGDDNLQADGSWQHAHTETVTQFSAACWLFAQELTDMALTENKSAPVLGLIQSAWGGSEIDDWIRNSSIGACTNNSGLPEQNRQGGEGPQPHGSGSVYPNNGALWNGMVPTIDSTLRNQSLVSLPRSILNMIFD